jgi:signal transduction histidine kinase
VNPDWLPPTNQNSVTYAGLGSGTYFFEVKAMNADGILSSVPASVMFTISPAVWQRWWFAGSIGFVLILLTAWLIRARVQRLLQIERMRSRIATDLHDEIGSNLGGIALMSDMVRRQVAAGGPESKQLADISLAARRMSDALRDIVWIINPMHDRMDNIILRMKDVASTLLSGIPYSLQAPEKVLTEVSNLEFRRNILLMYKEILHNIMKHAQATHVDIVIREERGVFRLSIADNGIGFDQSVRQNGNGLYNLKIRTEQIRGNLEIISSPHHGTSIVISAKIP